MAALSGGRAHASCNTIPGTSTTFRAALGTTDRPFARPGDFVALSLDPTCDAASPGFGATAADNAVTLVFTPASGAPSQVVIVSTDCARLEAQRQTCEGRGDVDTATCVQVDGACDAGGLEVFQTEGRRRLRFRFPDTDALLQGADDDRTLSGPAAIAVTGPDGPLPCGLASGSCTAQTGLIACVDDFYAIDGTCGTATHEASFAHFTALPPPNNYQAMCFDPVPPCTGTASEVRFTTDAAGNLLLPMDWRGVLVGQGVPVARLLRGSSSIEAFPGGGSPIRIPGNGFLRSYSPEGGLLPPVFDPQSDPTAANEATLFGSADAPDTVLRVARRSPVFQECSAGANNGLPCILAQDCPGGTCGATRCQACAAGANAGLACRTDADCPASLCGSSVCGADAECPPGIECGPSLFDFRSRAVAEGGPIVIPRFGAGVCQAGSEAGQPCATDAECAGSACVLYRVVARDPVPLDGLSQTPELNAFVVPEAVDGRDLNGDGDATDDVVLLADRRTGEAQPIGGAGASGRAVVRVRQPPFSFPAVATEGDVIAFLEHESATNDPSPPHRAADENGDTDTSDAIVRVFRLDGTEITSSLPRPAAVDAAPLLNRRSLAVSNGLVFFRTSEPASARQRTEDASVAVGQNADFGRYFLGSISADGRFVAFDNGQVFVRDRQTGVIENVSPTLDGEPRDGSSEAARISADGRWVAFQSSDTHLVAGDTNGTTDIFVRDRETGTTERVSVATSGAQANGACDSASLSADGRYVAFGCFGTSLVPGDSTGFRNIFVRDRLAGVTRRVSVGLGGAEPNNHSGWSSMSADGRYVAFHSEATNLVATPTYREVYVYDRETGTTEQASVPASGSGSTYISELPSLSADGRYVAFRSMDANLVPGDTNGALDTFVYDRQARTTERVSIATNGDQGNGLSGEPSISADGRYVVFPSEATNLVPGDTNGQNDIFVRDRWTGTTERVSVASNGGEGDNFARSGAISADGRFVAFGSTARNLVPGLAVFDEPIFVHGPDPADPAAVDASLFADGKLEDTVLQALAVDGGGLTTLCPATEVAIADGRAAFLRPESPSGTAACPGGSMNPPDTDVDDRVVQLWPGSGAVQNLHCAATAVALSDTHVAALVSEAGQDEDLNGDGDRLDDVVLVHRIADGDPGSCAAWTNTGQAAERLDLSGSIVAFLTPEAAQGAGGGTDLNGDGDENDRVVQVWDAASGELIPGTQAAEDFVLAPMLLAFRTREAAQGDKDLNGDGDTADDVLQVFDLISRQRLNTHQAVTPCMLEACDPRVPYRVLNDTVKFLTFEEAQAEDLDGNGTATDLVLQTFNVRLAQAAGGLDPLLRRMSAPQRYPRTLRRDTLVIAAAHTTLGATTAGICTNTAQSCATDANCAGATCYVPPGGCLRDLHTGCNPQLANSCGPGRFCQPLPGSHGAGTCHEIENNSAGVPGCHSDGDCVAGDTCNDADQTFERLVGPLTEATGDVVFTSSGLCVETVAPAAICGTQVVCATGQMDGESGTCQRAQGLCQLTADCPAGSICTFGLLVATDRDSDGDEIPDRFDNCPAVANVAQEDGDADGVGDACERIPACGDAVVDAGELCDDGNPVDGDGCDANCTPTGCGNGVVSAGEQCDDGNSLAGDGCSATCRREGIAGRMITLSTPPSSSSRRLRAISRDPAIASASLSTGDPIASAAGGSVRVLVGAFDDTYALPASAWRYLGTASSNRGYVYSDPLHVHGPIERVVFRNGRLLKIVGKGAGLGQSLAADPTPVSVEMTIGDRVFCMSYGGAITFRSGLLFRARNAPAPNLCPP